MAVEPFRLYEVANSRFVKEIKGQVHFQRFKKTFRLSFSKLVDIILDKSYRRIIIGMFENVINPEKVIGGYAGFFFCDRDSNSLVAMHWQHSFNHMVGKYKDIYQMQMPEIVLHVCRHTLSKVIKKE